MGSAQPVLNYRRDLPNGDIIQVAVWLLPSPLPGSSHHFKDRLHYQASDVIRYDSVTITKGAKEITGITMLVLRIGSIQVTLNNSPGPTLFAPFLKSPLSNQALSLAAIQ